MRTCIILACKWALLKPHMRVYVDLCRHRPQNLAALKMLLLGTGLKYPAMARFQEIRYLSSISPNQTKFNSSAVHFHMLEKQQIINFHICILYCYITTTFSYVFFTFSAGRCVSLDCEMVGTGSTGDFSMLARCSIVNHHGNVLYDSYVASMDKITDYRTKFSGITPQHLKGGTCVIDTVQWETLARILIW